MNFVKKIYSKIAERSNTIVRVLIVTVILVSALAVSVAVFTGTKPQVAVAQGSGQPFGGLVTLAIPCTCSDPLTWGVYFVDLAVPGSASPALLYGPSTQLFAYGPPIAPGMWMLGLYNPGGTCEGGIPPYCFTVPVTGTMTMVGTSG